ncbi:MAG: hypothetical protein ABL894_02605 [Hyphomicrobium sp.]
MTAQRPSMFVTTTATGAALVVALLAASGTASATEKPARGYTDVMPLEAKSKDACEAVPNRVFAQTPLGSDCVAYFVTSGHEKKRNAVIFFDGDMSLEKFSDPALMAANLASMQKGMQAWADKLKVRYVFVSRLGVNGSSGNHGERRQPKELMIMNTATSLIKQRLGLDTIALAGQSGGSTIAASMLSLGRNDVLCAVLGSGAFELVELRYAEMKAAGAKVSKAKLLETMFDPASHVDGIRINPARRILILGDEADTRTPFAQQERYAQSIQSYGHHAKLIRVDASGEISHGATAYTLPTAAGCMMGTPDERLVEANDKMGQRRAAAELANAAPVTSGATALMRSALSSGK